MLNPVINNLLMRQVITDKENISNDNIKSFELTSYLSRLQCSTCFYISYLSANEPRNCLRCTSDMLHDFPKTIQKKKIQVINRLIVYILIVMTYMTLVYQF